MNSTPLISQAKERLQKQASLTEDEALELAALEGPDLFDLLALANRVRAERGDLVQLCSIINARSGHCSEDCRFCAQSVYNRAGSPVYPFISPEEILKQAKTAEKRGAVRIGIVKSGNSVSETELKVVEAAIRLIKKETNLSVCASLGKLNPRVLGKLKAAGLSGVHHNLESSESFFSRICTTHSYRDRVETVRLAKQMGFKVCSGGIIGVGETMEDRIKLAFALKKLGVDSVPINILNPIPGTPLENAAPVRGMEILKTIALFKLILPEKTILVAGGRERNLRSLQALSIFSGASGLMLGNYLTTAGQNPASDLQMILDAGLRFENRYMDNLKTDTWTI